MTLRNTDATINLNEEIRVNTGRKEMSYYGRGGGFRERIARFMMGRYGNDQLGRALTWLWLGLFIINLFLDLWVISIIELLVIVWSIFRIMSKNIYKRQAENRFYLKMCEKIKAPFVMMKNKWRDRKTHVYKRCPSCKSTLRLPKVKGEHTVKCPRCSHRFDIRI